MPLARLDNLLKNLNGNILYVDPAQLDSTDSIDNRGNSAIRPFKTIQRALLEAVRFSYVQGANNDLFDQTTILISPGTHYIDNRPGLYVDGSTSKNYSGSNSSIPSLTLQSNFDLTDVANDLYKFNSADGGVIIPRGVSIVANDLRKTKIRPLYVPDPTDDLVERSAIFKLTGACYIYGFTIFDGDPNGNVFSNPTSTNSVPPSYSHHKLTAFEYADGKNKYIKNGVTLDKTDLEMYYYKVAEGYGPNSGNPVIIDWGVNSVPDLYPKPEENKIVGDLGRSSILISNIIAGDGVSQSSNIVTVTTQEDHNLTPLTQILVSNVGTNTQQISEYNGSFTVAQVISPTQFTYRLTDDPESTLNPTVNSDSQVTVVSDTVSSSSPYVFNCSLKSVYGLNGLHADGSKATGFKSIVTAQFTGISLQKDDRAFVLYNETSGTYNDQTSFSDEFLHQNSRALYKPSWESFHIKASNDSFIQCVSIFAIGYAKQFVADEGGDQSITNSNSNFGAVALTSRGFKDYELSKDNHGFITHIIPPKEITLEESDIRCLQIDSGLTTSISNNTRVYLKGYDNPLDPPLNIFRDYKVGGKSGERIYAGVDSNFAVVSPNYKLEREIQTVTVIDNSITTSSSITIGSITGISTGQSVRIISEDGNLPDGIESNTIYYINQSTLVGAASTNVFKLSSTLPNSFDDNSVIDIKSTVGNTSGNLKLVSLVSDRSPGDIASPFIFDSIENNWYINIQSNSTFINSLSSINDPVFYVKRRIDTRIDDDKLYRARIVIPKESINASEPTNGFIIQRSSSAIDGNLPYKFGTSINEIKASRNNNQIIDAWVVSGTPNTCHIVTKYPHNLKVGNSVNIYNLKSSNEPSPVGLGTGTGFNGSHIVTSIVDELQFTFTKVQDPGTITTISSSIQTWPSTRNCAGSTYRVPPYTVDENTGSDVPYFTCEKVNNDYQIYKINTIQKYSQGSSDGIYHVVLNCFKNKPSVSPFNVDDLKLSQSIENLYPSFDLDNPESDPYATSSIASRRTIGKVEVNNSERSVTKETTVSLFKDFGVGSEVSSITKSGSTCIITTSQNHGLKGIRSFSSGTVGSGFDDGDWYDVQVCGGSGSGATVRVRVSSGSINTGSGIRVINPGSGYADGDSVTLRGIPHSSTNGSFVTVTVGSVWNNTLGSIQVIGSKNVENDGFFPITGVTNNTITYENSNGSTESSSTASVIFSGEKIVASSASGTTNTTINCGTNNNHSLVVGSKVYFTEIPNSIFTVISVPTPTTFVVSGNASAVNSASDKSFYNIESTPTLRDTNSSNENILSRLYPLRDSIAIRTTNNANGDITLTETSISISNSYGIGKGSFVQIDSEIMLVRSISGGTMNVFRGVLGTKPEEHPRNTIVKKLNVLPIELRRNSILRASGHTFEYLGFGPGNYSTGMPTNQNRVLSDDEVLISQSLQTRGGTVLYTGMNSNGDYFIGRKKFNTLTGEEQLIGVSDVESGPITSFDDLTVNNLTITETLDATTATAEFNNIDVNGNALISGIATATGFSGPLTGNVTGDVTGNVTGEVNSSAFDTNSSGVIVTGIATATSFVGRGTIPVGGIIMWSGTQAQLDATSEWKLCDGTNGTPDLRNKFIVAANDISKSGTTTQSGVSPYEPGDVGGSADAVVVSHAHGTFSTVESTGGFAISDPDRNVPTGFLVGEDLAIGNGSIDDRTGVPVPLNGSKTNIGVSGENANLPPYYALAFIMRVS